MTTTFTSFIKSIPCWLGVATLLWLFLSEVGAWTTSTTAHSGRRIRHTSTGNLAWITPTSLSASTLPSQRQQQSPTNSSRNNNSNSPDDATKKAPSKGVSSSTASWSSQVTSSGLASAAAVATAAVNAAVAMKTLEAPDVQKSYIALDDGAAAQVPVDPEGLPLVYNKELIQKYWSKERGALSRRWNQFLAKAVPFLTQLVTLWVRHGGIPDEAVPSLSRQARLDLQDLGPTFIKLGQMMSVRPDVLPPSTLQELKYLQDSVVPFDTASAMAQIERELGGPISQFFASISEKPVAAASLAQVYRGTLRDGREVAIKVQRPNVLASVSQDLYVLRRAAEVFNGLVQRFAPQQKTDYVALLNEWAIGFYTELDFQNEASNQRRLRQIFLDNNLTEVVVPVVYEELCTRRVLVSEWMNGRKLSECTTEQIAQVTPAAQEAFLTQLFQVGFVHGDPHPGNLLFLDQPRPDGAQLALIDCGLMARIGEQDRDYMISAVIHLANRDYAALVDDFIQLEILPPNSNRAAIVPLMDKALTPYVKGGGAKKYEEELKKIYGMQDDSLQSQVGGFQAMTQDALTVLQDIPFSIPPSFALLGRAIVTLEGIALTGNPNYGIVMESYPFIARKLLSEGRPEIQKALQEVLYSGNGETSGLKLTRLLALLNNAAGAVATQDGAAFVDLDAIPENGLTVQQGLKFLLSDRAGSLRNLLEKEMDTVVDVLARKLFRRATSEAMIALAPPRPPSLPFIGSLLPTPPALDAVPLPILLPRVELDGLQGPSVGILTLKELVDIVAPALNQDEELLALGLADGAREFLGDAVLGPKSVELMFRAVRSGALGRADLVSNETTQNLIQFMEEAIRRLSSAARMTRAAGANGQNNLVERDLWDAVRNLNPSERERFDEWVQALTQRAVQRLQQRLSRVERIL